MIRRRSIAGRVAPIAVLLLALGCSSGGDARPDEDEGPLIVEPIEIELDEAFDGQEASLARNVFIIFDGSGSMRDRPGRGCRGDQSFPNKLEGAKWALTEFLKKVPDDVNLALYVFDGAGRGERVPLGNENRTMLLDAISDVEAGGGTPLAMSIRHGTNMLIEQYKNQLGYGDYRLVVVTDGRADQIGQAARYAARYGVPIYAIGLCIGEDHPLRRYAVQYRAADSFQDLQEGLEETLAELPSFDPTEFGEVTGETARDEG